MKLSLKFAILGTAIFTVLLLALHFADQTLDPSWQPISEYSLGSFGWLMKIGFAVLGAAMAGLACEIWRAFPAVAGRIAAVMIGLAACGNLLASVFNTDPAGTLPSQSTLSGQIHVAAAGMLGFFVLATPLVLWQFFRTPQYRASAKTIALATAALWVAEIVLVIVMAGYLSRTEGILGPETPFGWHARVLILICCAWIMITAFSLGRHSPALPSTGAPVSD